MRSFVRAVSSFPSLRNWRAHVSQTLVGVASLLVSVVSVSAHDPMSSWVIVQLRPEVMEIELVFDPSEAFLFVREAAPQIKGITYENFPFVQPLLTAQGPELLKVSVDDLRLTPTKTTVTMTMEDDIQYKITYARPPPGVVGFDAVFLDRVSLEHMTYLSVIAEDGTFLAGSEPIVGETMTFVDLPPPQAAPSPPAAE